MFVSVTLLFIIYVYITLRRYWADDVPRLISFGYHGDSLSINVSGWVLGICLRGKRDDHLAQREHRSHEEHL